MNEKRNHLFTICVIAFVLFAFAWADLVQDSGKIATADNAKPVFTWEAFGSGTYASEYDDFARETFVSKAKWVKMQTTMDLIAGKEELQGIYLGKGGYLFEKYAPSSKTLDELGGKLQKLKKLTDDWNATVMLIPSADNILRRKLPDGAPYFDETGFLEQAATVLGEEHYVDVYSVLNEHQGEAVYYKTDEHWTALAAFYTYPAWAEIAKKPRFPYYRKDEVILEGNCVGELQRRTRTEGSYDRVSYFPETERRLLSVTYDFQTERETMFNTQWLDEGDPNAVFLDGEHVFTKIVSNRKNGKKLFVLKDSYGDCFLPFLLPHYETIYVMELEGYKDDPEVFMKGFGHPDNMDVLILYGVRHFMESFDYTTE